MYSVEGIERSFVCTSEYSVQKRVKKRKENTFAAHFLNLNFDAKYLSQMQYNFAMKIPIAKTAEKCEDLYLETHRLPFIFNMDSSGSLESVKTSMDYDSPFWKNLQSSLSLFLSATENMNMEEKTVGFLKVILKRFGLNSAGRKDVLIQKIRQVRQQILLQELLFNENKCEN